jgi:hypothetical protein
VDRAPSLDQLIPTFHVKLAALSQVIIAQTTFSANPMTKSQQNANSAMAKTFTIVISFFPILPQEPQTVRFNVPGAAGGRLLAALP